MTSLLALCKPTLKFVLDLKHTLPVLDSVHTSQRNNSKSLSASSVQHQCFFFFVISLDLHNGFAWYWVTLKGISHGLKFCC